MINEIRSRFADPSTAILVVLVSLAFAGAWNYAGNSLGEDYYVAWAAADAFSNDSEHDVYSREAQVRLGSEYRRKAGESETSQRHLAVVEHNRVLHMTATPFLYWVINLFSTGQYETDLKIWHGLSLIAFVLSILSLCQFMSYSTATSLLLLLPCLVWMEPLHSELRVANVNSVQLGLVAVTLWLLNRPQTHKWLILAGIAGAATVWFKPNLAPLLIIMAGAWLIRGPISDLISGCVGMAASMLGIFAITAMFTGKPGIWMDWYRMAIIAFDEKIPSVDDGNVGSLADAFGLSFPQQVAVAVALSALVILFLWWGRRASLAGESRSESNEFQLRKIENAQLISLACIVNLLAFGLVWEHYLVLALPMLVTAFRPWSGDSVRNWGSFVLHRVLPGIALLCLMATPTRDYFEMDGQAYYTLAARLAVLILLVLGLWQLRFQDVKTGRS